MILSDSKVNLSVSKVILSDSRYRIQGDSK